MAASILEEHQATAPAQGKGRFGRALLAAAICLGVFQAARLLWLIDRYSVDVPFIDQWGFYRAYFTPHTVWQIFAWTHGMHRQGVGAFVTWLVNEWTAWDQRAQCFAIGLVMLSAAGAALWLKRRLFGRLVWHDVVLVLLILSPQQWELYAGVPNVSPQAMPVLLILLLCVAWTAGQVYIRYALVLALAFLATYTGFGMFVGVITPVLLAADLWQAFRQRSQARMTAAGIALALSLVSLASFFIDYHPKSGAGPFVFPDAHWQLYPVFMALQFAGLTGVLGTGWVTVAVGLLVLAGVLAVALRTCAGLFCGRAEEPLPRIVLLLVGFALTFSVTSAVGRLHLGLETAASSRYFVLLALAGVGVYLSLLTAPPGRLRRAMLFVLAAWTLAATMPFAGRDGAAALCDAKTRWVSAYLQTREVQAADKMANFKIHPNPIGRGVDDKLQWLAAHQYSLFRPGARHVPEPPNR